MGQCWPDGQKAVGPTSAANVGPTDVATLGQHRSDGGMLSGKYPKSFFSFKKQYKNPKLIQTLNKKKFKFNISDRVKISHLKNMFDKEYTEKWSGEIFTVINRKLNQNIPMYELKDYNNEVI